MELKAVLFDMDGLMIDSERLWEEAWHEAAAELELGFPEGLYRRTIGLNWASSRLLLREALGGDYPLEELIGAANGVYEALLEARRLPKPGLYELLDLLEEKRMLLGLATSTNRNTTERKLAKIGVKDRFHATVCGDEVLKGKPDPEPYVKLIGSLGVKAGECLALEDSHNGVRAASAAGARVVMVPDLLEATDEMKERCMAIVDTLLDVRELFLGESIVK